MPTHWTYESFKPEDDLFQGDILRPKDGIRRIFEEVHKHFLDPKYNAFLVLTQTCDLTRRDGKQCRSNYINLAVVRPLEDVLFSLLDRLCERVGKGVYTLESQDKARQLLERIFNQNEQALGIFYLHKDADIGIAVPSIAMLQVSIALRSREHYDVLAGARIGRLKAVFRDKLGWLVGNLFSRVATQDWEVSDLNDLGAPFLRKGSTLENAPRWVPKKSAQMARDGGVQLDELSTKEVVAQVERYKIPLAKDVAIECVKDIVRRVVENVSEDCLKKIGQRLQNDEVFKSALK